MSQDSEETLLAQMQELKGKLAAHGYEVNVQKSAKAKSIAAPPKKNQSFLDEYGESLRIPLLITAFYLLGLQRWAKNMKEATEESKELVWDVWNSPPVIFTLGYLAMIYFGKKFMKDRQPYSLKGAMLTYNLYQVILNVYGLSAFIMEAWGKPLWGQSIDKSSNGFEVAFLIWIHYNNKYVELIDTVFMVFRKKDQQVSFLHVYHHVLLIWSWFFVCKYFPGGEAYFGAAANSFIHVLMYSYYFAALLGVSCPWKKYLTQCQQLQFVVCFAHAVTVMYRGIVPTWLCYLQMWVMSNMLVLFTLFYMKAYAKKKASADAAKKAK